METFIFKGRHFLNIISHIMGDRTGLLMRMSHHMVPAILLDSQGDLIIAPTGHLITLAIDSNSMVQRNDLMAPLENMAIALISPMDRPEGSIVHHIDLEVCRHFVLTGKICCETMAHRNDSMVLLENLAIALTSPLDRHGGIMGQQIDLEACRQLILMDLICR